MWSAGFVWTTSVNNNWKYENTFTCARARAAAMPKYPPQSRLAHRVWYVSRLRCTYEERYYEMVPGTCTSATYVFCSICVLVS